MDATVKLGWVRVVTRESQPEEHTYIEDAMDGRNPPPILTGQGSYAVGHTPEPSTQWGMFALGLGFGLFIGLVLAGPWAAYCGWHL
jgi:hypothetical protein